jgi:transposase
MFLHRLSPSGPNALAMEVSAPLFTILIPVNWRTFLLFKIPRQSCLEHGNLNAKIHSSSDRKVFSEQTSHTMRYSRRTARASSILDTLSIELTGKLGSLLSKQLLLPVSTSTVTRIAMKQKLPEVIQPIVLGVDDWAFRKGVNYGTILIDMETSRPIDLLASRERSDLERWLKKYPNVKIVKRDRASSYFSAINEVCPDAIQVADRFHLLLNLSDALDKYFKSIQSEIRRADKK